MNKLRIVFMGTPHFATTSLEALVENNYKVVGVITAPDKPAGRGQKLRSSSVKEYALSKNLPVLQPNNLKDHSFITSLKALKADVQVVVAFRMLPEIVWNMPPKGTFNLHASLLPKYRGAAPINWAVINGDKESGVSTFFIEHKIDTGNIIFQDKIKIKDEDNAGILHDKLMFIGSKLVCKTIDAINNMSAPNIKQKGVATLAPKILKEDCQIDWNKNIHDIHNHIRGLSPYPSAWTTLSIGKNIKIYQSLKEVTIHKERIGSILTDYKNYFKVAVNGGFIHIITLQLEGKKQMSTADFLRGFKHIEKISVK